MEATEMMKSRVVFGGDSMGEKKWGRLGLNISMSTVHVTG